VTYPNPKWPLIEEERESLLAMSVSEVVTVMHSRKLAEGLISMRGSNGLFNWTITSTFLDGTELILIRGHLGLGYVTKMRVIRTWGWGSDSEEKTVGQYHISSISRLLIPHPQCDTWDNWGVL
jgi:hypothetical protein